MSVEYENPITIDLAPFYWSATANANLRLDHKMGQGRRLRQT